jgi:hypothetical protein
VRALAELALTRADDLVFPLAVKWMACGGHVVLLRVTAILSFIIEGVGARVSPNP